MKPVVLYSKLVHCRVGTSAYVYPIDHPNCSNLNVVSTSTVLSYDKATGCFETKNTIYKPKEI